MKKYLKDLIVVATERLRDDYVLLRLSDPSAPLPDIAPGQFVELQVPNGASTFLRRPISVNDVDREAGTLDLLVHAVGEGTRTLCAAKQGDSLSCLFPLGHGFWLPQGAAHANCPAPHLLLVGGGVGTAPLLYYGRCLREAGCEVTFLLGGRRDADVLQRERFAALGHVAITTEDGSAGERGFVTQHSLWNAAQYDRVATCGPKPMMMAVARLCAEKGFACEASLENLMACGVGACLCCVEKKRDGHNVCVCKEGPVFNTNELSAAKLDVSIGALRLKNPVLTASGTFGYGLEFADLLDLNRLGGFIVKGTTLKPREGNDYPRMAETPSGMLNCVGLQNKGAQYFCEHIYPQLEGLHTNVLVNVSGSSPEDYAACAECIAALPGIPGIELNISCPNVRDGGMAFGTSCEGAASVVRAVRRVYPKTLIVKLSPNVTDIASIARAVEGEGADSVSLINTLMGMSIDLERRRSRLSIGTGGLSGPAVKPVALRMVWQVARAVKIPVVGLGGIMNATDALEFLMAGASAVEIGTANFIDPTTTIKVIDGINAWLDAHGIDDVNDLIGTLEA